YQIPVHYLLYHPRQIPSQQTIPVSASQRVSKTSPPVGCIVTSADYLRSVLSGKSRNYAPSFGDLFSKDAGRKLADDGNATHGQTLFWRLEQFITDELI